MTGRCSSSWTCVTSQKRSTTSCLGGSVNPSLYRSRSGKQLRLLVSFLLVEDDIHDDIRNASDLHWSILVISDGCRRDVSVILRNNSNLGHRSSEYRCRPESLQDNGSIQKVQDTSRCDDKQDCILGAQPMWYLGDMYESIASESNNAYTASSRTCLPRKSTLTSMRCVSTNTKNRRAALGVFKAALVLEGLQPVPNGSSSPPAS